MVISTSILCIHADGLLTCTIQPSIEGAMAILTLAVFGATFMSMMFHHNASLSVGRCPQTMPPSNCHISQVTPSIEVLLSILESVHHKLLDAHGVTLVTPSLCGWEAFLTLGAPIHTRITPIHTKALSPMAPQVPGITPGFFLCPCYCGHSSWRGARHRIDMDAKSFGGKRQ